MARVSIIFSVTSITNDGWCAAAQFAPLDSHAKRLCFGSINVRCLASRCTASQWYDKNSLLCFRKSRRRKTGLRMWHIKCAKCRTLSRRSSSLDRLASLRRGPHEYHIMWPILPCKSLADDRSQRREWESLSKCSNAPTSLMRYWAVVRKSYSISQCDKHWSRCPRTPGFEFETSSLRASWNDSHSLLIPRLIPRLLPSLLPRLHLVCLSVWVYCFPCRLRVVLLFDVVALFSPESPCTCMQAFAWKYRSRWWRRCSDSIKKNWSIKKSIQFWWNSPHPINSRHERNEWQYRYQYDRHEQSHRTHSRPSNVHTIHLDRCWAMHTPRIQITRKIKQKQYGSGSIQTNIQIQNPIQTRKWNANETETAPAFPTPRLPAVSEQTRQFSSSCCYDKYIHRY